MAHERIRTLQDHSSPYVTTSELAEYWMVSRSQIYKHIDAGTLRAIRLGPRLLRISTQEALDFEQRAKLTPATQSEQH
jgi:excisionase family DNA binding protein